jgi:beta-ribofuranosylaminobenzene 5'-phosphate synthase
VTHVVAPSRLHFGLLSIPGGSTDRWPGVDGGPGLPMRQFGGVGLMIDRPGIAVRVEPANDWSATGSLAVRTLALAQRLVASLPGDERRPFRVTVEHAPEEHTGLGVGTQLGLAVAKAIATETGHDDWPATELAVRIGRGERSAIGVHGFDLGGLIVEAGKLAAEAVSPLVNRFKLPPDWVIFLFKPRGTSPWHGGTERLAFETLGRHGPSAAETDAMCRIVLTGLLPALAAADLNAFAEALYELNARAGDAFAPVQGGRYGSPEVTQCIAKLRAADVRGVGQSSWGPTVFAIVHRGDADRVTRSIGDLPAIQAQVSHGHVVNR